MQFLEKMRDFLITLKAPFAENLSGEENQKASEAFKAE